MVSPIGRFTRVAQQDNGGAKGNHIENNANRRCRERIALGQPGVILVEAGYVGDRAVEGREELYRPDHVGLPHLRERILDHLQLVPTARRFGLISALRSFHHEMSPPM